MSIKSLFTLSAFALSLNACDNIPEARKALPYEEAVECIAAGMVGLQQVEEIMMGPSPGDYAGLEKHRDILNEWLHNSNRDAAYKGVDKDIAVTDMFKTVSEKFLEIKNDTAAVHRLTDKCAQLYLSPKDYADFKSYSLPPIISSAANVPGL